MSPLLQTAFELALASYKVSLRRLRQGPARPTWSLPFEVVVEGLRDFSRKTSRKSPQEQRLAWDTKAPPNPILRKIAFTPAVAGGVPAEWLSPRSGAKDGAAILYLHGGSYIFGSSRSHREMISYLTLAAKTRALALNYRLAPENPFPAALEDALAAYRWLLAKGFSPSRIVLVGDSAGGGLSVATLLSLRDAGEPLPAGAALICPWVDLAARGGSLVTNASYDWGDQETAIQWAELYLQGQDPRHPLASPVYANLEGLPPLMIQVGSAEILFDQVQTFAERARAAKVDIDLHVWSDMIHNWHALASMFSIARRALAQTGEFIQRRTTTVR